MNARRKAIHSMAALRAAIAKKYFPAFKRDVKNALQQQAQDVADLALKSKPAKIPKELLTRWAESLKRVQAPHIRTVAAQGWTHAGTEVGLARKAAAGKSLTVSDFDSFVQRGSLADMTKWIQTTAVSASATSGERLQKIFQDQIDYIDPETGRGLTPFDVAKEILRQGIAASEDRAKMLANTGAIWAANEGAVLRYQDEGIAVCQWLTAEDDLRCPFCFAMNGKYVSAGDPFLQAGDTIDLGDVGTLKIPTGAKGFDVRHPPLHPNCRCTVVPIVDESQL